MKYLVTGGAGFVGSHLVERLVKEGHKVDVIDDLSNGSWDNLTNTPCTLIEDKIESVSLGEYDGIFHLATHPRSYSVEDPYTDIRTNMLGMTNVLECARETGCRVIFSSNSGIVSNPDVFPITELHPDEPTTPYDVTKLASEHLCKVYHDLHGVRSLVLRFAAVYGPRQKVNDELKWYPVLPTMLRDSKQGKIWITGDGKQVRDFIYVGDIVDALVLAMNSDIGDARKYLIGTGVESNLLDIHHILEDVMGKGIEIEWREEPKGGILRNCLDSTKAHRELGWHPKTTIRQGVVNLGL